jgi:serine/threonine-protein kinase
MDDGTKPTMRGPGLPQGEPKPPKKAPKPTELPTYIGRTIGERYKIVKKLGEGGMGAVYLAEHILIEKKVAIKVLTVERSQEYLQRFAQEAKSASRIGHENIIDITDFGDTGDGAVFLCMEYLEGKDLGRTIRGSGPQTLDRCVRVINQVCSALEAAHGKGIIHRDLKPDNIFLVDRAGRSDFVKILDFGLARVTDLPAGQRITQHGQILGTPEYMSPEQVRGDHIDARTDVYAAGMVLYEMLTGDVPFKGVPYTVVLGMQLTAEAPPPSKVNTTGMVTAELDAVVMKALKKDPDDRFATMKDLALALCAATGTDPRPFWGDGRSIPKTLSAPQSSPVKSAPLSVPQSTLNWGWLALAAGIAVVIGGLYWLSKIQAPPKLTESKLTESKLTESKLTESKLTESKLTESKLTEPKPAEPKLGESKLTEPKKPKTKRAPSAKPAGKLTDPIKKPNDLKDVFSD